MYLVSDFSCCRIFLKFQRKIVFYSMHVWVVNEDKWCSFCGALLGFWLKSFGLGDFRNSVYGRLYGVW